MMSLLQSRSSNKTGKRVSIDLQKAERALKDSRHQEVEQLCAEVIEERPDAAQAYQILAELRLKQRRYEEGMAWVDKAREINADNPRTLNLYGRVLDHREDLAGAEAAFRRAVELDPGLPDALANLGHVLLRTGRAVEAEPLFRGPSGTTGSTAWRISRSARSSTNSANQNWQCCTCRPASSGN
jgi:Flp pilus assembly protein TadD